MNMQYAQAVVAHEKALLRRLTTTHANAPTSTRIPWSESLRVPALVGAARSLESGNDGE
jgi:hypothetical protein